MIKRAACDDVVGDRYRLARSIAIDVFGEIWSAIDERDGSKVHLRALDPSICVALGASGEVLAIARSGRRHPRVAALLDVIVEEDRWFLISEAWEGETLVERIARDGALPEGEAIALAADVADGLAAIHAMGAVHGRLDPSRIVLERSGARICDLGLGMLLGDDSEEWRTTLRSADDPTVAFLSPEQARGEGAPTAESDVWALAAVLHFALTGFSPYSARSRAAQASAVASGAAIDLDTRFNELLRASLAPEPSTRPSIARVAEQLRKRPNRRWPRAAFAVLAVVLLVAFGGRIKGTRAASHRIAMDASAEPRRVEVMVAPPPPPPPPVVSAAPAPSPAPAPKYVAPRRKPARDTFYGVTSAGF